jgi:hypothetical protein
MNEAKELINKFLDAFIATKSNETAFLSNESPASALLAADYIIAIEQTFEMNGKPLTNTRFFVPGRENKYVEADEDSAVGFRKRRKHGEMFKPFLRSRGYCPVAGHQPQNGSLHRCIWLFK